MNDLGNLAAKLESSVNKPVARAEGEARGHVCVGASLCSA